MVCFSHHTYNTTPATVEKDLARLAFFYDRDLELSALSFTLTNGLKHTVSHVKIQNLKTIVDGLGLPWTSCTVDIGRRWTGLIQNVLVPNVPLTYVNDASANQRYRARMTKHADDPKKSKTFSELYNKISEGFSSIAATYESGHEVSLHCSEEQSVAEMHDVARGLILDHKIEKAFYEEFAHEYYLLVHNRIVILNQHGLFMGHDIDFDLDDGFFPDTFQSENYYVFWNQHYFETWKEQDRPCVSPLPMLKSNYVNHIADNHSTKPTNINDASNINNVSSVEPKRDSSNLGNADHSKRNVSANFDNVNTDGSKTGLANNQVAKTEPVFETIVPAKQLENEWNFPLVYVLYQSFNKVGQQVYNDSELESFVKSFQKMATDKGMLTVSRFDPVPTGERIDEFCAKKFDKTVWTVCITHDDDGVKSNRISAGGSFSVSAEGLLQMFESTLVTKGHAFATRALMNCESVPEGTRVYRISKKEFQDKASYFINNPMRALKQTLLTNKNEYLNTFIHRS